MPKEADFRKPTIKIDELESGILVRKIDKNCQDPKFSLELLKQLTSLIFEYFRLKIFKNFPELQNINTKKVLLFLTELKFYEEYCREDENSLLELKKNRIKIEILRLINPGNVKFRNEILEIINSLDASTFST